MLASFVAIMLCCLWCSQQCIIYLLIFLLTYTLLFGVISFNILRFGLYICDSYAFVVYR